MFCFRNCFQCFFPPVWCNRTSSNYHHLPQILKLNPRTCLDQKMHKNVRLLCVHCESWSINREFLGIEKKKEKNKNKKIYISSSESPKRFNHITQNRLCFGVHCGCFAWSRANLQFSKKCPTSSNVLPQTSNCCTFIAVFVVPRGAAIDVSQVCSSYLGIDFPHPPMGIPGVMDILQTDTFHSNSPLAGGACEHTTKCCAKNGAMRVFV